MAQFNSEPRESLQQFLDAGTYADPVPNYATVAAILETAMEAGFLYTWSPSAAGGPIMGPLDHILIDVYPVDPDTERPVERGHLFASYAVTFARGLIAGDLRADIAKFRTDAQAAQR